MTIQQRRDEIFRNYGTDVDEMNSVRIRDLITALDQLADDLEDQEALVNNMKEDMLSAINEIAEHYKKYFDTIYLFGGNINEMTDEDIEFKE